MTLVKTDSTVPQHVKEFLDNFYRLSDDAAAHDEYADQFVNDAEGLHFQIGPMPAVARKEDIRAWRHKAWQPPVISRSHEIHDVFMKQGKDDELMLRGSVKYGKQDGSQGGAECGAWMVLAGGQRGLKIKSYTVWVTPEQK